MGKHVTIYIKDDELYRKAQKKARELGTTLSEIFAKALKEFVQEDLVGIFDIDLEKQMLFTRLQALEREIQQTYDALKRLKILGIMYNIVKTVVNKFGGSLTPEERKALKNYMRIIYSSTYSSTGEKVL